MAHLPLPLACLATEALTVCLSDTNAVPSSIVACLLHACFLNPLQLSVLQYRLLAVLSSCMPALMKAMQHMWCKLGKKCITCAIM
jgi:hypothetical protein